MCFNCGAKITKVLSQRFCRTRKRSVGCYINRKDFGAERCKQLWSDQGAGAIAGIEHHPQLFLSRGQWP